MFVKNCAQLNYFTIAREEIFKIMKVIILFSFLLISCNSGNSPVLNQNKLIGKVVKIIDGDTFDVLLVDNTTVRIRMFGIDCPERRQDYYQVCKDALGEYIFGKNVELILHGKDAYRRTLAEVFFQKENINVKMVKNGFAWHFKKYSSDLIIAEAENNARKAKIGLWKMDNSIAPWKYRELNRIK